jgi:hypothetical protein
MENLGEGAADTAGTASDEDGVASETHRSFPLQDVLRIVRVGFTYRIGAAWGELRAPPSVRRRISRTI